jgi:putative aminopeptidase FrvX
MDFSFLKQLAETPGVSGREERVRTLLTERMSRLNVDVTADRMGNLIARIPGDGPRVALLAHMDEVGFLVSKIEPGGFLRVMPTGGVDPRVFWAQKVIVHGRKAFAGVVGSVPPHLKPEGEAEKVTPIEECFIDLGLPFNEVADLIGVGDPVTFSTQSWETESAFFAKALDDRVGLFVMLEVAGRVKKPDCELFLVASTQEEYGLRGAGPAVYAVKPEIALALEGTVASDTPGLKLPANVTPTTQGMGPEIRLMDKRMISDRALADFLVQVAREKNIPHQLIVKKTGSTDATITQVTAEGVRACTLSVPVRYIHGPTGTVLKADVEQTIALVSAFVERASQCMRGI